MSRPDQDLDRPDLQAADRALADYASSVDAAPAPGFADWVMRSVAAEALPRRGFLAGLAVLLTVPGPYRLAARAAVVTLVLAAGVGSAVALGQITNLLPDDRVGTSPSPVPSPEASPTISPTPSPSAEPSPSPSPSPTVEPSPSRSAAPTPAATPEASEGQSETPTQTPESSETPQPT